LSRLEITVEVKPVCARFSFRRGFVLLHSLLAEEETQVSSLNVFFCCLDFGLLETREQGFLARRDEIERNLFIEK
jgi:hypothetical protein